MQQVTEELKKREKVGSAKNIAPGEVERAMSRHLVLSEDSYPDACSLSGVQRPLAAPKTLSVGPFSGAPGWLSQQSMRLLIPGS